MIKSFADAGAEQFWRTGKSKGMPPTGSRRVALRKLLMLDGATDLRDLLVPPGNRLEARQKDRRGQHSIRINEQYRICFRWTEGNAYEVEIVDYHR